MKFPSFLCIFLGILASCTHHPKQEFPVSEYYDLSKAEPGELTDIFSDVELTPLLFEGDFYPSEVYTLHYHDSLIMVQDNRDHIYVFDTAGHYISSSKQVRGQGPGEFSIYMAYSFNPYTGLIQVLTINKLMCYDTEFNFVEERPVPMRIDPTGKESLIFSSIYDLSPHNHLLTTLESSTIENVYISFDSNSGELGDTIDFSNYIIAPGNRQYKRFFKLSSGEYLAKPGFIGEYIFSFNPDKLELTPAIKIDMGKESVTKEEVLRNTDDKDAYALENYLEKTDRTVIKGAHPTKDKIFCYTSSGRRLIFTKCLVADRNTGEIKKFDYWDDDELFFPRVNDLDDEYLYSGISKYELLKSPSLLLGKDLDLNSLLADYDDDTLIMLRYKIK